MIAAWMLFSLEIGALVFLAAVILEAVLRASGRPTRIVWIGAIVVTGALSSISVGVGALIPALDRWTMIVSAESMMGKLDRPLLVLWGVSVAVGMTICLMAVRRMARQRPQWKNEHVDQTPVLVSHDIGPALVGVLHYSIVVPQWAFSLEERARRLLLAHEREHARQYDPLLLVAAVLVVVAAPWNLFSWLFLKRLHLAVEMDCDQRVLRAHPDARGYGALLLDVAERVIPSVVPAAAFVEHGASLEKRLNAMMARPSSSQLVRTAAGVAASALLLAVACVTPRPQAAPQAAQTRTAAQAAEPSTPRQSDIAPSTTTQTARGVTAPTTHTRSQLRDGDSSILPVAPSAQTLALDVEESDRMRTAVLLAAPRTFENWARADSALVLLFNARGDIVKQATIAISHLWNSSDPRGVFAQVFTIPEINGLEFSREIRISRGARFESLAVPLRLFMGRLKPGAAVPLTREEVVPTHAAMVATLREKYPELLKDNSPNPMVGGLLFGSRGELLATAALRMDMSATLADGTSSPTYDSVFMKKAFGSVMDSGAVVQSGRVSYFDDTTPHDGLPRLIYAVIVKRSQFDVMPKAPTNMDGVVEYSSSSSRVASTFPDRRAMNKRLLSLVQTRVPDAFGAWSRADSAVIFLFDEDDQLIARRAAPIPESGQLLVLADLLSQRITGLQSAEVETVGTSFFTASPSGRQITPGLHVIWGRLKRNSASGVRR